MASKLGVHITAASDPMMRDFLLRAQPAVVKLVDPDVNFAGWVADHCPESLLMGRRYFEQQPWDDPRAVARAILSSPASQVIEVWEGLNEPARGTNGEGVRRAARFDLALAQFLHAEGYEYVAGSWSVGVPDIEDWLLPEMQEALRIADYIGVHEYNAPRLDDPRGIEWFLLRHRLWYPSLLANCQKPLIITECGIDSGAAHWPTGRSPGHGWRSFTDAPGYVEQLAWYDAEIQADEYVVGATLFQWGSLDPRWDSFDHTPELTRLLGDYLVSHRDTELPPPVEDWRARALAAEAKLEQIRVILR